MRTLPVQVVLDANFLTIPADFGIDIFAETERVLERQVEFIVLDVILKEIEIRLSKPRGKTEEKKFRIAMDLVGRCRTVTLESDDQDVPVDTILIEYTASIGGILATNDRNLKKKARSRGIPVLMMRGKKTLGLEGAAP